jgi:putative peptidoglycan lipid II flippase
MSADLSPSPAPLEPDSADAVTDTSAKRPGWLRLSHQHTALSATLLLMASTILSRVIGLLRDTYTAWRFGAGGDVDSYTAAFQLPDMINYFLVGGVASIAFVSILGRYREQGKEKEGEDALSAILSMMLVVLGAGIVLGEVFARYFVAWWFDKFTPEKIDLTTHMTRILLPVQLFFFAGGVLGSVLIVRKQFAYQAIGPLIYNLGIIFGGVTLAHRMGISGLSVGALIGVILGPFLINAIGVYRTGFRLRLSLAWNHPGVKEWVQLSLPLILGVSLVTFDTWIINRIASAGDGQIAQLNYAKKFFTAPMAILGMAAGAASMPFFASLIGQGKRVEFARLVNGSVTRIAAVSLLGSAWMIGLAKPAIDLMLHHGALRQSNADAIALYFSMFAISLCFWSAQSIYARAFYAAGNTLTPMIAGTIITIASYPVYKLLYRTHGTIGLVWASNIGIFVQTMAMAVLLHHCKLARLSGIAWKELTRTLLTGVVALVALRAMMHYLPQRSGMIADTVSLTLGTLVWVAISAGLLIAMGSQLPQTVLARFRKRSAAQAA